ncbi:MAG TPA: dienelactone hydrolase [Allosphingosinicella sp.]|nr:dienelactone hydrolase [Allosphingosinicella sp.]
MKLALKIIGGIVGLLIILAVALATYVDATAIEPERPVGFQQVAAPDPGRPSIAVTLWYPTDSEPGFILLGSHGERVASDAPVAGTGLPLVVISHGTGAGPMSHADTAIALAESGFVVAALTHGGDNYRDDSIVGRPQWMADRSRQVSRVIDFMLRQWGGADRIDPDRVGLFGFSAGGTTALIALGGVPDLGRAGAHCAERPEFVCNLIRPGPGGPGSAPPQWVHDRRIGAAVVAAPGLGFAFSPAGLSNVRVPVQLWAGAEDRTVPYATNAALVRRLLGRPPEFHGVPGAAHASFLMPCGLIGPPALCRDSEGFDRRAFHRDFNRSVTDFFRRHLVEADRASSSPVRAR